MQLTIPLKKLYPDAKVPTKATQYSAGFDVYAHNIPRQPRNLLQVRSLPYVLLPDQNIIVGLGFSFAVPIGFAALAIPRSGLSTRLISITNSPGLIDADYRYSSKEKPCEVGIILENRGVEYFRINKGDRIAQLMFVQAFDAEFPEVEELEVISDRVGGFGHTGV